MQRVARLLTSHARLPTHKRADAARVDPERNALLIQQQSRRQQRRKERRSRVGSRSATPRERVTNEFERRAESKEISTRMALISLPQGTRRNNGCERAVLWSVRHRSSPHDIPNPMTATEYLRSTGVGFLPAGDAAAAACAAPVAELASPPVAVGVAPSAAVCSCAAPKLL